MGFMHEYFSKEIILLTGMLSLLLVTTVSKGNSLENLEKALAKIRGEVELDWMCVLSIIRLKVHRLRLRSHTQLQKRNNF